MAFKASNDRITITDTNGDISFDTESNIPMVTGYFETTISKVFLESYYTEEYFNLTSIAPDVDFMMCSAECTPYNMQTGKNEVGFDYITSKNIREWFPWVRMAPEGENFFQGSMLLETGCTGRADQMQIVQYARRALHVYSEPEWGDRLVCMFQQGVKSGFGAVPGGSINFSPTSTLNITYQTWNPPVDIFGQGKSGTISYHTALNPNHPVVRAYGQFLGYITTHDQGVIEEWTLDVYDPIIMQVLIANGDVLGLNYGSAAIRWDVKLKVWSGRFR